MSSNDPLTSESSAATGRFPARRGWLMTDLFALSLLTLFVLDVAPCTPQTVRHSLSFVWNGLGIWQGPWRLFAPEPDRRNHRLSAAITYADGTQVEWKSPEWRRLSVWRRIVQHRESEYFEKIWEPEHQAAWSGFADSLARQHQPGTAPSQRPRKVILSADWGDIPPPKTTPWPSVTTPTPLTEHKTYFQLEYP